MKIVNPSAQVAHLWANKSQATARTARDNFHYTGDTIYSYSTPVAEHQTNRVVLLTIDRHSVTTNGHMSDIRRATTHLKAFTVPYISPKTKGEHKDNFEYLKLQAIDLLKRAHNAIEHTEAHLIEAQQHIDAANDYAKTFKIGLRKPLTIDALDASATELQQKAIATAKEQEKRAISVQKEINRLFPEMLAKWRNCTPIDHSTMDNNVIEGLKVRFREKIYFRLIKNGNWIESNKGAMVPAKAAHELYEKLEKLRSNQNDVTLRKELEAFQVGSFGGNNRLHRRIEEGIEKYDGGITIGCHVIPADEIEALGELANW